MGLKLANAKSKQAKAETKQAIHQNYLDKKSHRYELLRKEEEYHENLSGVKEDLLSEVRDAYLHGQEQLKLRLEEEAVFVAEKTESTEKLLVVVAKETEIVEEQKQPGKQQPARQQQ